ncbi:MAG: glutaredoxin family protein [Bdellovibrio sp.]|jgi:hypothetical protein
MIHLFHRISDSDSAELRRLIGQLGLEDIQYRNVDMSESAQQEMQSALGRLQVPALLTKEGQWIVGLQAARQFLEGL